MHTVMVVGAGPAGLMAAEVLATAGLAVHVFDAMPSVGRKFLLAGKGGLNLTHAEPADLFVSRYGERQAEVAAWLANFDAQKVQSWAAGLGIRCFVGSSGRVFPQDMKAAPLLRAWLQRLRHPSSGQAVQFQMRHRWTGGLRQDRGLTTLDFDTPNGKRQASADAVVLALGGGSWARLGSDGAWVPWLESQGVRVAPLLPANCGFDRRGGWSPHFTSRFAGLPFKSVAIRVTGPQGVCFERKGEFVATSSGVEGSLIYAASRWLRDAILMYGQASFTLDLLPGLSVQRVLAEVSHPRGSRSMSSHLKSRLHLDGIKSAILYELLDQSQWKDPMQLAGAIKGLPIELCTPRPLDEAISTAGGVAFQSLDESLMLLSVPAVWCAGEMLDWEAPTGGYLLTACLASGVHAARGVLNYFQAK